METTTKLTLSGLLGDGCKISHQKNACLFLVKETESARRLVVWSTIVDELIGDERGYINYHVEQLVTSGRYFLVHTDDTGVASILNTKLGQIFHLPFAKEYEMKPLIGDSNIWHVHAQYFLLEHNGELHLFDAETGKSFYEVGMKGQEVKHILGPYIMIGRTKVLNVKTGKYCLQAEDITHIRGHYFMVQYKDSLEEIEIQNVRTRKGNVLPFSDLNITHIKGDHFWIHRTMSGEEWNKKPSVLNIKTGKITKVA